MPRVPIPEEESVSEEESPGRYGVPPEKVNGIVAKILSAGTINDEILSGISSEDAETLELVD
ncbi:MAG: hypothetical protein KDN22_12600 [Verrucomicrobiae bacterium]|nr:hypothetical protein [Verrucomicrobiae bacterium]